MANKKTTRRKTGAKPPLNDRGRFARITAVGRSDKRNRFTLLTRLSVDKHLDGSIESYGSIVDMHPGNGAWNISLFRLTSHNGIGRIYYGDFGLEDNTTNIYKKQIELGELFTVQFDPAVSAPEIDIVFQIDAITDY